MNTTMTKTESQAQTNNDELSQSNGRGKRRHQTFSPRFDIWEGEDELVLYGDLPGVEPDSLNVTFENRQLTIYGKVDCCHGQCKSLYSEYGVGDFERTFTIGDAINGDGIHAEVRDGVLTLHLPKSESAKPRRIAVKAN